MKKVIGCFLVIAVVFFPFVLMVQYDGIKAALFVYGLSFAVIAMLAFGIYLIFNK